MSGTTFRAGMSDTHFSRYGDARNQLFASELRNVVASPKVGYVVAAIGPVITIWTASDGLDASEIGDTTELTVTFPKSL